MGKSNDGFISAVKQQRHFFCYLTYEIKAYISKKNRALKRKGLYVNHCKSIIRCSFIKLSFRPITWITCQVSLKLITLACPKNCQLLEWNYHPIRLSFSVICKKNSTREFSAIDQFTI